MRPYLLIVLLCFLHLVTQAQKPQLLVYGNDALAFSAAVQGASSGVSTLWISTGEIQIGQLNTLGIHQVKENKLLDAGIWATFLEEISGKSKLSDSALNQVKLHLNGQLVKNAVQRMADSLQNLTHLSNVQISDIQRKGQKWNVQFSNHRNVKLQAIVDASEEGELLKYLEDSVKTTDDKTIIPAGNAYNNTLYRTSLFTFDEQEKIYLAPFISNIQAVGDNFYSTYNLPGPVKASVPAQMLAGQAIGAAAAYGAFYKTSSDNINIRRLQGELLAFGGALLPLQDISRNDPHYIALQRIAATGLFKGQLLSDSGAKKIGFFPDSLVTLEDIKPTLLDLYTRSQIWFQGKTVDTLSLSELMDLIKFTALKGDEIDRELERGWSRTFHFKGNYAPEMPVNRRQTAVIIDYFLDPFKVNINKEGQFLH